VTLATGGIIGVQGIKGQQDADYLAEGPLIALMFLVMVWHGRRRLAATQERLTAVGQVQRGSPEKPPPLGTERPFLGGRLDELGTPITVALGHAELIEQAATDQGVAADARVVTGELARLRRLTNRLLLLASAGTPGFLHVAPVATDSLILGALERWGHVPRHWRPGAAAGGTGGSARGPRPPCPATPTGSWWRWTRCSRTPSRTPSRATGSRSASASRTRMRSSPWPTPAAASRRPA